jgi:hypothetical protein
MAAAFLSGYKRKRAVLIGLFAASLFGLGLAGVLALSEAGLPLKTQLDELRLLDPSFTIEKADRGTLSNALAPELGLSNYVQCQEESGLQCSGLVKSMLENRPADGRLWLEYARSLTLENGMNADAVMALQHSYEYAPHEFWVLQPRSSFALSVWPGLPKELQDKARNEIIGGISNTKYARFLADIYAERLLSRKVIADILEAAPVDDQRRVLGLINARSKT